MLGGVATFPEAPFCFLSLSLKAAYIVCMLRAAKSLLKYGDPMIFFSKQLVINNLAQVLQTGGHGFLDCINPSHVVSWVGMQAEWVNSASSQSRVQARGQLPV